MMHSILRAIGRHPKTAVAATAAVVATGTAAYEYEGSGSGRPWPPTGARGVASKIGAEVLKIVAMVPWARSKLGLQTTGAVGSGPTPIPAVGSYSGSVPSSPGGTPPSPTSTGAPTLGGTAPTIDTSKIDLTQLPAPGAPGAKRKTANYYRWVQTALNSEIGAGLMVDGKAGGKYRSAVRNFQMALGSPFSVDGVVGPQTEYAIIALGAGPPPTPVGSAALTG